MTNIRYDLEDLLGENHRDYDIEVQIIRPMGAPIRIYSYERENVTFHDDHLIIKGDGGRERKILYRNIARIIWKPLFNRTNLTIEGEYR